MIKVIAFCLFIGLVSYAQSCANEGQMCAGFAGIQCCSGVGLRCHINDTKIADNAGTCITGCRRLGESCGGIAGLRCCGSDALQNGLHCHITDTFPDAMGSCVNI